MGFGKLTIAGMLVLITPSIQAQTLYSGADLNAGPGNLHPNSLTAAAQFDSAAANFGTVNLINFESAPLGNFTSLSVAPGVVLAGSDFNGNPLLVKNTPNFPVAPALDGFNVTTGGANYVEQIGGTATFTFTTPIQAFGVYVTGVQTIFFQDTITFNDGTVQTINVPSQQPSNANNASLSFVGFTDPGKFITQVTITASGPLGADAVGIDDVRYVLAPAAVPEPGSVALLAALGLSGACVLLRRMRAPKAA